MSMWVCTFARTSMYDPPVLIRVLFLISSNVASPCDHPKPLHVYAVLFQSVLTPEDMTLFFTPGPLTGS